MVLAFKATFNSEQGKIVFSDLLNRYLWTKSNPPPGANLGEAALFEKGQRSVVEDILSRVFTDMAEFEKRLRGEL